MEKIDLALISKTAEARFRLPPFILTIVISLSMIMTLWLGFRTSENSALKFQPLVDAVMEIKYETAIAHLWLEELLQGDTTVTFEVISQHFDNADWYANALLKGGSNSEGTYIALEQPQLRHDVSLAIAMLATLRKDALKRQQQHSATAGTVPDSDFDRQFNALITHIDNIETELQQQIQRDISAFRKIQLLLIGLIVIATAISIAVLYRYEKQRINQLHSIHTSLREIKLLSGLLPICASCKKIRDDKGYWGQLESYISEHSEAVFSHGICPDCKETLYPKQTRK